MDMFPLPSSGHTSSKLVLKLLPAENHVAEVEGGTRQTRHRYFAFLSVDLKYLEGDGRYLEEKNLQCNVFDSDEISIVEYPDAADDFTILQKEAAQVLSDVTVSRIDAFLFKYVGQRLPLDGETQNSRRWQPQTVKLHLEVEPAKWKPVWFVLINAHPEDHISNDASLSMQWYRTDFGYPNTIQDLIIKEWGRYRASISPQKAPMPSLLPPIDIRKHSSRESFSAVSGKSALSRGRQRRKARRCGNFHQDNASASKDAVRVTDTATQPASDNMKLMLRGRLRRSARRNPQRIVSSKEKEPSISAKEDSSNPTINPNSSRLSGKRKYVDLRTIHSTTTWVSEVPIRDQERVVDPMNPRLSFSGGFLYPDEEGVKINAKRTTARLSFQFGQNSAQPRNSLVATAQASIGDIFPTIELSTREDELEGEELHPQTNGELFIAGTTAKRRFSKKSQSRSANILRYSDSLETLQADEGFGQDTSQRHWDQAFIPLARFIRYVGEDFIAISKVSVDCLWLPLRKQPSDFVRRKTNICPTDASYWDRYANLLAGSNSMKLLPTFPSQASRRKTYSFKYRKGQWAWLDVDNITEETEQPHSRASWVFDVSAFSSLSRGS